MPNIATSNVYDNTTGIFYTKGSVVPDDANVFGKKKRGNRTVVPGFDISETVATDLVQAGSSKAKGRKPTTGDKRPAAKKPAKKAGSETTGEQTGDGAQVKEGGEPRSGGADNPLA